MKNNVIIRISCLLLCLCLTVPLFCLPLSATPKADDANDSYNDTYGDGETKKKEPTYVDWQISEKGDSLTANGCTYYLFDPPSHFYCDADTVYQSVDTVTIPYLSTEDYDCESAIYATQADAKIVWLDVYGTEYYYATENQLEKLRDYASGVTTAFRLAQGTKYASLSKERVNEMFQQSSASNATRVEANVQALQDLPCFELIAREETGTFSYVRGTIYQFENGDYYFVDHKTLDNTHFDANGNFSYRSGTVSLTLLSGQAPIALREAKENLVEHDTVRTYEDEGYVEEDVIIFWIFFILIGFLLPLPLLIVGLILPHSQKRGYPKYWYRLSIAAGVWIVLSIVITVILLAVQ